MILNTAQALPVKRSPIYKNFYFSMSECMLRELYGLMWVYINW